MTAPDILSSPQDLRFIADALPVLARKKWHAASVIDALQGQLDAAIARHAAIEAAECRAVALLRGKPVNAAPAAPTIVEEFPPAPPRPTSQTNLLAGRILADLPELLVSTDNRVNVPGLVAHYHERVILVRQAVEQLAEAGLIRFERREGDVGRFVEPITGPADGQPAPAHTARPKISGQQQRVLDLLRSVADGAGQVEMSVNTMGRELGMGPGQANACRLALIAKGALREARAGHGRVTALYQIIDTVASPSTPIAPPPAASTALAIVARPAPKGPAEAPAGFVAAAPAVRIVRPDPESRAPRIKAPPEDVDLCAPPESTAVQVLNGTTLLHLKAGHCKWPVNNAGRDEQHLFCAAPVEDADAVYCDIHAFMSVDGSRTKRKPPVERRA